MQLLFFGQLTSPFFVIYTNTSSEQVPHHVYQNGISLICDFPPLQQTYIEDYMQNELPRRKNQSQFQLGSGPILTEMFYTTYMRED